ncbi:MAG: periplasmic divalent cation tolerance protein [Bradymonadia bacterium]|jgi:periplasmic divalent cation tolerance protein
MKTYFVYVTCASIEEAKTIAMSVVGERLAACANIIPGMESIYWWEGELEQGNETVLVLKTPQDKLGHLMGRATELHSYDLPCIVALEIADASPEYLAWLVRETRANSVVGDSTD